MSFCRTSTLGTERKPVMASDYNPRFNGTSGLGSIRNFVFKVGWFCCFFLQLAEGKNRSPNWMAN